MSEITTNDAQTAKQDSKVSVSSPYPFESLNDSLELVKKMVAHHGTATPISKEEISIVAGKAPATMVMRISTCVQYGILKSQHGKGYLPTEVFQKYSDPVYDTDETKAKLQMFQNAPLYAKIIEKLNHEVLPSEDRFSNLLKSDLYKINANSAKTAAKVFFENAKDLNLIDAAGRFRFSLNIGEGKAKDKKSDHDHQPPPPKPPVNPEELELFTLPIPLGGKRRAFLKYPLEDLSRKDIRVIRKALDFIESSIEDPEEVEENKRGTESPS